MWLSIFLKLVLAQVVVGAIVVVCLKKALDHQLLDLAYRQIDCWKPQDPARPVNQIILTTHKKLGLKDRQRFQRITLKRLGESVGLTFTVQKDLMGGAVLRIDDRVVDYSLKDRLRQALSYR